MGPFGHITFDCYGTLIDWRTGIIEAVLGAALEDGVKLDAGRVLALHHRLEPDIQRGAFRSYREVLEGVARGIAREVGWPLKAGEEAYLPDSVPTWRPFEDTNRALTALADAGYRLGILSNVDDDLLSGTLRQLAAEFDLLITAQQVRSYKPAHDHFLRAREQIGDAPWRHVAQSYFHDIEPATTLGIASVWVNRLGEAPGGEARPTAETASLDGLLDVLNVIRS